MEQNLTIRIKKKKQKKIKKRTKLNKIEQNGTKFRNTE